jgi:hypothetical protein
MEIRILSSGVYRRVRISIADVSTDKERTMTIKMAQAPPTTPAVADSLPDLPTFPLDAGFREIYDPEIGASQQLPLTLLDILYPAEEDIGVVITPQSPQHSIWATLLVTMLRIYLPAGNWLIPSDVLIIGGTAARQPKRPI